MLKCGSENREDAKFCGNCRNPALAAARHERARSVFDRVNGFAEPALLSRDPSGLAEGLHLLNGQRPRTDARPCAVLGERVGTRGRRAVLRALECPGDVDRVAPDTWGRDDEIEAVRRQSAQDQVEVAVSEAAVKK